MGVHFDCSKFSFAILRCETLLIFNFERLGYINCLFLLFLFYMKLKISYFYYFYVSHDRIFELFMLTFRSIVTGTINEM